MAGQSDAADDLIAELAKLMAQDAHDDRNAPPAASNTTPPKSPTVRIPGDAPRSSASQAPADFARSASAPRAEPRPAAPENAAVPAPAADPFNFDFGFQRKSEPAPVPANTPAVAAPPPTQAPVVAAVPTQPAAEHDSIADLISAELAADPAPPSQVESPAPAAPAPPRAAADAGPAPMSTTVAASTAGPEESLGSPRPDQDRFKVPPVFGLGSTAPSSPVVQRPVAADRNVGRTEPEATFPAITTPAADDAAVVDPIDEIENLIGRAMTVEFDLPADAVAVSDPEPVVAPPSPAPRPAPSPALRSLATPTLPVSAPSSLSTADQTIFAAAQASGAKVGWVTPSDARDAVPEDRETEAYQSAPRQRRGLGMSRALAGPVVAVTLLLAAGFGLYWVLGLSGREAGPAPLLTVDTAPTKQAAPAAGADGNSPPQSVVFSEMDGTTPAPDEQLLSRDQTDVNEVTQAATAVNGLNDEGLANRKVRTVKVRPDGTIVSGEDAVAGSTILPVDRPNVPAIAGAETTTTSLLANTGSLSPPPATTPAPQTASADVAITPVEPGSTVTAVDLAGNPIAGKTAVVPLQRPSGLRAAVVPQAATDATTLAAPEQVAATPTASPTIPGATEVEALGNTAPAYVQLASQRNEADARQSAQNMVTRYGPLFGGANLEVQRVDLGAKGIYYRVRVPANSLEQANLICTNVKAAGGDCFTM